MRLASIPSSSVVSAEQTQRSREAQASGLSFFLFILLNGLMFVRPAENIPDVEAVPIYALSILCCLAVSMGPVLRRLTPRSLKSDPITVCVLGVLASIVLSHLACLAFGDALRSAIEFLKIVVYYFLLISVVDSPARYRRFVFWLGVFITVLTVLPLLQYHGYLEIPGMEVAMERQGDIDRETGETIVVPRLQSTGEYNNPNDLARILVVGIFLGLYLVGPTSSGRLRPLWIVPTFLFGYGLHLTHSRGGLLALLAGVFALLYRRLGRTKAILLSLVIIPALMLAFGGRQTNIDTSTGTGQLRIKTWNEGFARLRGSPVFGIGMGQYKEQLRIVAHNSFVQCFVELGLVGGTLFLGAFYLPVRVLKNPEARVNTRDPEFHRFRPYLLAILIAWMVGMIASERSYSITTYVVAGLGASYFIAGSGRLSQALPRVNFRLIMHLVVAGLVAFVILYVYVRLSARY